MAKLVVLFNHRLTDLQKQDVRASLGVTEFIEPDIGLRQAWANIPTEAENVRDTAEFIRVRNWLGQVGKPGDYVLIQGEFGATFAMVQASLQYQLIPIYSTTKRQAVEEHQPDGGVITRHLIRHVRFRKYQP